MDHFTEGLERGAATASWVELDTDEPTLIAFLRDYEDGVPEVLDIEPAWLSGEWAGESLNELGLADATDEELDRYEDGCRQGFWDTLIERAFSLLSDEAQNNWAATRA